MVVEREVRRDRVLAAALTTFAPLLVWYSQEARMYSLLLVFSVAALWLQVRAIRYGRIADWLGFVGWWFFGVLSLTCITPMIDFIFEHRLGQLAQRAEEALVARARAEAADIGLQQLGIIRRHEAQVHRLAAPRQDDVGHSDVVDNG